MDYRSSTTTLLYRWTLAMAMVAVPAAGFATEAIDADAAIKLAKNSHCLRCHAVDKKKEGPSYSFLAARYEGKPGAEDKLLKHITSGNLVKLSDWHKENHKALENIDTAELRNLVRWILAQG